MFVYLVTNLRLENCPISKETILSGQYRLKEHPKACLTDPSLLPSFMSLGSDDLAIGQGSRMREANVPVWVLRP